MNDFIKIFIGLCALVVAFLFGRNYGEKGYRDSEEYKALVKSNEELNFAKNELENVKAKFQNIADGANTKRTDELLGQILTVFLADLGLRIENKNAFIKADQNIKPAPAVIAEKTSPPETHSTNNIPTAIKKEEYWTKSRLARIKSLEWMTINSTGDKNTLNSLKKIELKNLNTLLAQSSYSPLLECADFLGVYKGNVKDIDGKYFGSFEFELKSASVDGKEQYQGKMSWYNNGSAYTEKISNNCGKSVDGLNAKILSIGSDKYAQLYKLSNLDVLAGNFYEVLPNGTAKIIGNFALKRVDKF